MSSTNQQGSKTPGQMLKIGSSVVIVPIVVLIFLIKMNLGGGGADERSMAPEMVLSRIAPVALYNTGAPLPEPQGAVALTGEQVYNRLCMTCHDTGVTDAPIKGNAELWAPRIAQGADVLFQHSLEGFNAMPAKGGDASLSDEEVKNAVVFMVNASGGNISVGESGGDAAPEAEEAPAEEAAPEEAVEETATPAEEAPADPTQEATPAETNETTETEATEALAPSESEEAVEETTAPAEEAPVEEAPTEEEAPAEVAPVEDATPEAPVEETEATPEANQTEETAPAPTEEAPVDEEPATEAPAEETPVEEVPAEEVEPEAEEAPLNQQAPAQESI